MSVAAAVFESLIAGVYLDGGLAPVQRVHGAGHGARDSKWRGGRVHRGRNYKSLLRQYSQKMLGETPVYRLLDEKGPDHSKCFKVTALIGAAVVHHPAWGRE